MKEKIFNILNSIFGEFETLSYKSLSFKLLAYFSSDELQKNLVWFKAAENGDVKKILQICERFKGEINISAVRDGTLENRFSALHLAVLNSHPKLVKKLLDLDADPNVKNGAGDTAMHCLLNNNGLLIQNYEEIANALIKKGADKNIMNKKGNTLLHTIAGFSHPDKQSFNENIEKCAKLVKILATNSADVFKRNIIGETALHLAISGQDDFKRTDIIEYLASLGPEAIRAQDSRGNTPLHLAASQAITIGNRLIEIAPDAAEIQNINEETPLITGLTSQKNEVRDFWLKQLENNPTLETKIDQKHQLKLLSYEIMSDDTGRIQRVIDIFGADLLNVKDEIGDAALHKLFRHYNRLYARRIIDFSKLSDFLIKNGAKINIENAHSQNYNDLMLLKRIEESDLEEVKKCIALGAKLNSADAKGNTALHLAAEYVHVSGKPLKKEIFDFLVENGANARAENKEGMTCIDKMVFYPTIEGDVKALRELMKEYKTYFETDERKIKILIRSAVLREKKEVVDFIFEELIRPELHEEFRQTQEYQILYNMFLSNDVGKFEESIKNSKLNFKENEEETERLLELVIPTPHQTSIDTLVAKGANLDLKYRGELTYNDVISSSKLAESLCSAIENENVESVRELLKFRLKDNSRVQDSDMPLRLAVRKNSLEIFNTIMRVSFRRSEYLEPDEFGNTILHEIALVGNLEMATRWARIGVDLNSQNNQGNTALHLAARENNQEIIEFLVKKFADQTIKNEHGQTYKDILLQSAIKNKDLNMVKELMASGANVNVKSEDGKTGLILANEIGDQDIINFLKGTATVTNAKDSVSRPVPAKVNAEISSRIV